MKLKLKELRKVKSANCITISLNTHKTLPEVEKDPILLKNLITEAENRLLERMDKRDAQVLVDKLHTLESEIDHRYNLDSLVLFVNEEIAEYERLPIPVVDRVTIDKSFAIRDLLRALHKESHYYVLVLSQNKARLIEALNDHVVAELKSPFPMVNDVFHPTSKAEEANAPKNTNLMLEFFNRVDKELNNVRKQNPLPVIICSDVNNFHEYLKVADHKETIFEKHATSDGGEEKAHQIVEDAWKIVKQIKENKNSAKKENLDIAIGQNRFLSGANEIWQAIQEGRVSTLYIEDGKFQPAKWNADRIEYLQDIHFDEHGYIDDILDDMIEANLDFGGEVVFLPKGELEQYDGFVATTRF